MNGNFKKKGTCVLAALLIWATVSFAEKEEEICMTKSRLSSGMSVSTVATMYALIGYCTKKNSANEAGYNKCVADGIPAMVSGMVTNGLATEQEIQDAKKAGIEGGYKLFAEGTDWLRGK